MALTYRFTSYFDNFLVYCLVNQQIEAFINELEALNFYDITILDFNFESNEIYMNKYNQLKTTFNISKFPKAVICKFDNYSLGYKVVENYCYFSLFDLFNYLGTETNSHNGISFTNYGLGQMQTYDAHFRINGYLTYPDSSMIYATIWKCEKGYLAQIPVVQTKVIFQYEDGSEGFYYNYTSQVLRLPFSNVSFEKKCCLAECFGITE